MSSLFIAFSVSLVEGLAGGVLQNYRLNDLASSGGQTEHQNDNISTQLLPNSQEAFERKALEDFDDEDNIFEEFSTPRGLENHSEYFQWKDNRTPALEWLVKCFWSSFCMVAMCGFLIGVVTVAIMFIDINTADVCYNTPWKRVPYVVKRVRVTVQVIEGWALQFFHIVIMLFVFGFRLVDRLHLLNLNIAAAFVDSVYRLSLQLFNVYDWPGRPYPLNIVFVGVMIINSYIISRHYETNWRKKLLLTFQLGSQFILGTITMYITFYLLIPWFIRLDPIPQAVVAASAPICGAICKTVSRISIQNISYVNHPGSSYAFMIAAYAASALVYRTLQAEIESFSLFILLCMANASVGLLERLSVVLRDHFYVWFYKKVLKREPNFHSFVGSLRTPRTQRLVADITICNIIHEITALIFTNAFVQLYALQVGVSEDGQPLDSGSVLKEFFIRTLVAILIEYLFTVFGVFVLTWYMNIPILRIWQRNWRSLFLTNLFALTILVVYTSEYLIEVVASKYEHLPNMNSTDCDPTKLLFFK